MAADVEIANRATENEKQNLELLKDDTAAYLDERYRLTKKWYKEDVTAETKRYQEQLANRKAQGIKLEQVEALHNANKLNLQLQYAIDLDAIDKETTDNKNAKTVQALEDAKAARDLEIEGIKATEKKKEKLRIQAEIDYQTKRLELARQGVIKGVPDIVVLEPSSTQYGLFVELKVGKNKLTKEQSEFLQQLKLRNYEAKVCYSLDEFQKITYEYFGE